MSPAASVTSAKETDLPPIEGKFSEWLLLLDDNQLALVMDQFQLAPSWLQTPEMQVRKAEVTCLRAKRKLRQAEFEEQSAAAALRIALLNQASATGGTTPGVGSQDAPAAMQPPEEPAADAAQPPSKRLPMWTQPQMQRASRSAQPKRGALASEALYSSATSMCDWVQLVHYVSLPWDRRKGCKQLREYFPPY